MTAKEAYKKLCDFFDEKPVPVIIRDYDDMYGFFIAPEGTKKGEQAFVGNMVCVMKDDGKVIFSDELEDQSFHKAYWTSVDLDEQESEETDDE